MATNANIPPPPAGFNVIPPPPAGFEMQGDSAATPTPEVAPNAGLASPGAAPAVKVEQLATPGSLYEHGSEGFVQGLKTLPNLFSHLQDAIDNYEKNGSQHNLFKPDEDKTLKDRILNPIKRLTGMMEKQLNPLPPDEGQGMPNRVAYGAGNIAGATVAGDALTEAGLSEPIKGKSKAPVHFDEVEAANKLTDAVNPAAKEMPKFVASTTKQIGRIMDYAEQNKLPLESREDFFNATKGAKEAQSTFFYEKLLNPVKDEMVGVSGIKNYEGATLGEGRNVASLAQLDARLTQLNAELSPSYAKTGNAGNAAVRSHADLAAEASGIRQVLYPEMARRHNMDPATGAKQIADVRSSIGELGHIAEQTQSALMKERHAANATERQPITINPLHKGNAKFIADEAVNKVANKLRTTPDDVVGDVFKHLKTEAPAKPAPGSPAKPKIQRPENNTASQPMSVGTRPGRATIEEMIEQKGSQQAEAAKANDARIAANRTAREATKKAAEEVQQRNRATHGRWKGAKALGENE